MKGLKRVARATGCLPPRKRGGQTCGQPEGLSIGLGLCPSPPYTSTVTNFHRQKLAVERVGAEPLQNRARFALTGPVGPLEKKRHGEITHALKAA